MHLDGEGVHVFEQIGKLVDGVANVFELVKLRLNAARGDRSFPELKFRQYLAEFVFSPHKGL